MRRKSERVVNKKSKASPERTIEKPKRPKTRRKKQSSSSDNESNNETSPAREVITVIEIEKKAPETPSTIENTDEADQVWQVKTSEGGSGDVGEIQKLKLCLTRPPSTPERGDKSPRNRGKHSRTTSSSDTPSVDSVEEKKKKHRFRKLSHDVKNEKSDAQIEHQKETVELPESSLQVSNEVTESTTEQSTDSIVSTTNEKDVQNVTESTESEKNDEKVESNVESKPDADTTVLSPKLVTTVLPTEEETVLPNIEVPKDESNASNTDNESPACKRSVSIDKSEILELHPEDTKIEMSDNESSRPQEESKEESNQEVDHQKEVSINQEQSVVNNEPNDVEGNEQTESINKSGVVESENKEMKDVPIDSENKRKTNHVPDVASEPKSEEIDKVVKSNTTGNEQTAQNGQAPNRKRRWGSRPVKLTTQKSITISTDVLKEIIPDVKPVEFDEVIEEKKKHRKIEVSEKIEKPILPKIVIDNTENIEFGKKEREKDTKEHIVKPKEPLASNRKISIIKDNDNIISRPPSPPKNKQSCVLYITNLVRPFTSQQLKNLLLRTGKIIENGFWMDKIKSKCFVQYEKEDQAVETRHALHGIKWPVSNPKTLQVDFSTEEAFEKARLNEDTDNAQVSTVPGTVEDWLREQDLKREKGEMDKPWERKAVMREWDVGKNEKDKERDKARRDDYHRPTEKRRQRSIEKSPEPARKFKKKEEEAPAKLLDDLFRKTKTTPCIYWLPLSAETIAVKEEQRRQHMIEYERRMQEQRRPHRRH